MILSTANDPEDARDAQGLTEATQKQLAKALSTHFPGEHKVQVEGEMGERRLVWRYKPESASEAYDVSVWYVYATTRTASESQVKEWKQKAVKNASFITREECRKEIGLTVREF